MQGTAGVAIAGLLGAVRAQGRPMIDFPKQKIVVAGAGRFDLVLIYRSNFLFMLKGFVLPRYLLYIIVFRSLYPPFAKIEEKPQFLCSFYSDNQQSCLSKGGLRFSLFTCRTIIPIKIFSNLNFFGKNGKILGDIFWLHANETKIIFSYIYFKFFEGVEL